LDMDFEFDLRGWISCYIMAFGSIADSSFFHFNWIINDTIERTFIQNNYSL
jgi:hypothetical protein